MAAFLAGEEDAVEAPLPLSFGVSVTHGRQVLPAVQGPDGLFYALIHKAG